MPVQSNVKSYPHFYLSINHFLTSLFSNYEESTHSVAPILTAFSNFLGLISTPTIYEQPAYFKAYITAKPTAPSPKTAAVVPG
jgi:hypothetical protein